MRWEISIGEWLLGGRVPEQEFGRRGPAQHVQSSSWLEVKKAAGNNRLLCRLGFGDMRLVVVIGRMFRQRLLRKVLGLGCGCRRVSMSQGEAARLCLTFYIVVVDENFLLECGRIPLSPSTLDRSYSVIYSSSKCDK